MSLLQALQAPFKENGFPILGAVDWNLAKPLYSEHAKRYEHWIQSRAHATMQYLERGMDRRKNPELVFPKIQSTIVVARPYPSASKGRYAKYLHCPTDYHDSMKADFQNSIAKSVQKKILPEETQFKVCVDTSAVLERTWASLCGIGWIGKNTLLIHPKFGSYLFLGVAFLSVPLNEAPKQHADYCGSCTRCLNLCPTKALEPHWMNSERCISYRTLEHRGEWKESLNHAGYLAGCDLCQEACPFNHKITQNPIHKPIAMQEDLEVLIQETPDEYLARVKDSALSRVKPSDFDRNLCAIVFQETQNGQFVPAQGMIFERIKNWKNESGWSEVLKIMPVSKSEFHNR